MVVAMVGLGATLATPLGLENWRQVALSLTRSQANLIAEWQPPGFAGMYLFFWLAAAGLVVGLASQRRDGLNTYERLSAVAALLAFLLAARAMRNVPAFMMLALPSLSVLLFGQSRVPVARPSKAWTIVAAAVVALAGLAAGRLWRTPTTAMDWHPVAPAIRDALAACRPPLANTYTGGGPIIWFVPSQPVFVDSRQDPYPLSVVQAAMALEDVGDAERFLASYPVNCAILPPRSLAVQALARLGWSHRAADERWVVMERPIQPSQ